MACSSESAVLHKRGGGGCSLHTEVEAAQAHLPVPGRDLLLSASWNSTRKRGADMAGCCSLHIKLAFSVWRQKHWCCPAPQAADQTLQVSAACIQAWAA